MNKCPPKPEGSGTGGPDRSRRAQSDVLALVALFGMIFVGAGVVLVSGGYLIDSVQGSSQHELAKDSAVQTHQSISEALQSGEARNLGVGDDVDVTVLESGSITIEMMNSSGGACKGDDGVDADRVEADLGAIVYDTPKGEVVYQGGAIWERTEAGLSAVRAPPIAYDDNTARVSIQTVSAEADSFEGEMARPNETMQTEMAAETERLLTRCPANGYTDLQINVTSPNYAELWKEHFEERVDGGPDDNVAITPSGDSVVANISNATSAHASRGLWFANVSSPTVVGPSGTYPNQFNVSTEVANADFESREATVKLEVNGTTLIESFDVPSGDSNNVTVPAGSGIDRGDLTSGKFALDPNEAHDYTVRLLDGEDEIVENASGRFFLESETGGNVSFFDDSYDFETDDEDTLVVNSTLINTYPESKNETVEFQITDDGINMSGATPDSIEVPGYGGTKGISYEMNVSQLGAGTYDYELRRDDQTLERDFTIQNRAEDSSTVGDLLVEDIDPSATYLETGEDFEVEVQLYNAGEEATPGVSLDLTDGNLSDSDDNVTIPGGTRKNVTVELDGDDIADELETRAEHEYNVTVEDDGEEDNQHFTGEFFLKEEGDGDVTFLDDSYDFETDDENTLVVNSTLINTYPESKNETVEFQITDDAVNMTDAIPTDPDGAAIDVPGHGTKDISYQVNVSQLRAGTYDYVLSHDEVELERNFTIENRPEDSSTVGDVRVEDIDPSATYLETGEDFEVEVQLYNTAGEEATPDVSLDLIDDALSDTDDVTIPGGTRKNVTVDLDGDDVADELETRTEHEYNVTVEDDDDDQSFPGSFVVLESGTSLQIDDHETTTAGEDWRWINATLANHGMVQGADTPTLTVYDGETDEEVGSIDTGDPVEIDRANEVQVPFGFDRSELGGAYRYELSYGEDTVEGYFTEGEADTGDGNVSITEPGNGTVSVLGTEVSAYSEGGCSIFGCRPAQKSWAPTTVSTVLEIDGEETVVPFENTAADESNYENETNLNTFDTQDDVYTYDWSQVSGESATLTVSSSYWPVQDGEVVSDRDGIEDVQPGSDILDENPAGTVNANSGTNKEAVQVLKDGDDVPNPQTSGEDQRSAAEILNQGAADRIDDDGTLDLGPYEAVFLFELTEDAYPGMWDDADESDEDPDYNDVIALVSFNPDEPDDVTFDVGDHSLSIGPAPNDPEETNDSGEQNVDIEPIDGSGDGSGPTSPDPQSPDPDNPSGADEVDVEVDESIEGPGAGSEPASPDPGSPDPGNPSNPDQIDVDIGGVVIG